MDPQSSCKVILALAGMSATQIVLLAMAIVGLTIVMLSTRKRIAQSRQPSGSNVRRRYEQAQERNKAGRDIETVMVELDQLARQVHGRMDTRFAKLEMIIRDADERIENLSRLVRAAQGSPTLDVTLEEAVPDPPPVEDKEIDDERYAPIYRLADSGLAAAEIAREVDRTTGEIELILSLRRTRRQANRPAADETSPTVASPA